jgi:hypothetical protein
MALINFSGVTQEEANPYTTGINNALKTMLALKYAPAQAEADIALKKAEAQQAQAIAQLPFGGRILPGAAGVTMGLEILKNTYGENSPQYIQAKALQDIENKQNLANIAHLESLVGTQEVRNLTNDAKSALEEYNIKRGFSPSGKPWQSAATASSTYHVPENQLPTNQRTNLPLTNDAISKLKMLYGQGQVQPPSSGFQQTFQGSQQGASSQQPIQAGAENRQQLPNANYELTPIAATEITKNEPPPPLTELEQEIANRYEQKFKGTNATADSKNAATSWGILNNEMEDVMDKYLPALQHFSGTGGKTRLIAELAKSSAGQKTSKEFQLYQDFQNNFKSIVLDSIRRALKTSVQPGFVRENLGPMADPTASIWNNSDQVKVNMESLLGWVGQNNNYNTNTVNFGTPESRELQRAYSDKLLTISDVNKIKKEASQKTEQKQTMTTKKQTNQNITQEDLEYTAKKHGITVEEVKKRLGIT